MSRRYSRETIAVRNKINVNEVYAYLLMIETAYFHSNTPLNFVFLMVSANINLKVAWLKLRDIGLECAPDVVQFHPVCTLPSYDFCR